MILEPAGARRALAHPREAAGVPRPLPDEAPEHRAARPAGRVAPAAGAHHGRCPRAGARPSSTSPARRWSPAAATSTPSPTAIPATCGSSTWATAWSSPPSAWCPQRRLMFEAVYGFLTLENGVPDRLRAQQRPARLGRGGLQRLRDLPRRRGGPRLRPSARGAAATSSRPTPSPSTPTSSAATATTRVCSPAPGGSTRSWASARATRSVLRLMNRELARMKRDPRHRSSLATLEKLATENVFYDLGRPREDIIGRLPLGEVGLKITRLPGRPLRRAAPRVARRSARARPRRALGVAWPAAAAGGRAARLGTLGAAGADPARAGPLDAGARSAPWPP